MLAGSTPPPSVGNDAPSINYPIISANELPTIDSIRFFEVGFWTCLTYWILIILDEIRCKNSCNCFWMYFWKAVLDHHPINTHCCPGSNWMCFNFVLRRIISLVLPMATTDKFVLMKGKRDRWILGNFFIGKDSWDYWLPEFDRA